MKPVEGKNTAADLFRLELVNIIDMRHELVKLAEPLQICQIPHKPIIR